MLASVLLPEIALEKDEAFTVYYNCPNWVHYCDVSVAVVGITTRLLVLLHTLFVVCIT